MKHLLKSIAYLALVGAILGAFSVASSVAWAALQEFYYGEGKGSVALYTTIAAVGVVFLGCEVFQLYSKYMSAYVGKPLLEKYQKELEAEWLKNKGHLESNAVRLAMENTDLEARLARVREDLRRSRETNFKTEELLTEAMEELKVLRGPLELSKPNANA